MADPHSVPQMECEHCHRMLDHCACPEPEPTELMHLVGCSNQALRELIDVHGSPEEAAMAIGERIAAVWDRHVDTSTILDWLQSTAGEVAAAD